MFNDDIVVEDSNIAQEKFEVVNGQRLGLPELLRKGFVSRLLGARGPDKQEKQA